MKGWTVVEPKGLATEAELATWVELAARYAGSLPAKQ